MHNPDPDSLRVIISPHDSLTTMSESVEMNDDGFVDPDLIQQYCNKMTDILTSFKGEGIGLAANQVGLHLRIFVCMDNLNQDTPDRPIRAYINPKIVDVSGRMEQEDEGCLSFPGLLGKVGRMSTAEIEYYDINGEKQTQSSEGLQARCWQHEIDHLDGINIPDKFDPKTIKKNAFRLRKLGYQPQTAI